MLSDLQYDHHEQFVFVFVYPLSLDSDGVRISFDHLSPVQSGLHFQTYLLKLRSASGSFGLPEGPKRPVWWDPTCNQDDPDCRGTKFITSSWQVRQQHWAHLVPLLGPSHLPAIAGNKLESVTSGIWGMISYGPWKVVYSRCATTLVSRGDCLDWLQVRRKAVASRRPVAGIKSADGDIPRDMSTVSCAM